MEENKATTLSQLIDDLLSDHVFGEPWRLGEKNVGIVVPILRMANIPQTRGYNMLEEVKDKVTIEDTGSINQVKIKVKGDIDRPVFIRGGGVLEGMGTQSRAVQFGTVIIPEEKEQLVPVLCVHESHGISYRADFSHKGYVPRLVAKALARRNQGETWNAVNLYADRSAQALKTAGIPSTHFAMDDLVGVSETVERFRTDVEEAMKKIPGDLENQVGVAIFDLSGPLGIEVFDHPESWQAISKSVVRQYTDIIVEEKVPDYLEINMDKVLTGITSFLERAKKGEEEKVHEVDGARTVLIKGDVVGEYTLLDGRSIHLLLTRKEKEPEHVMDRWRERSRLPPRGMFGVATTSNPVPAVMTAEGLKEHFFRRRGGAKLLLRLSSGPKTWTDISPDFSSSVTQSRRLKEATELGFIQRSVRLDNGREVYKLTQTGQAELKKAKELYAQ